MKTYAAESTRVGLEILARAGLNSQEYFLEALDLVGRAVPYDAMCFGTIDPATTMMTASTKVGLVNDGGDDFMYFEYAVDDVSQFADLANRAVGVSILAEETRGDLSSSARYTNVVAPLIGARHELRGVTRVGGMTWGAYAVYRGAESPAFNAAEADYLQRLEASIAAGIRAAVISTVASNALGSGTGPAVLVFDANGELLHATPSAEERVRELGGELWSAHPVPIRSIVAAVRGRAAHAAPRIRARASTGRWYTLHAAAFRGRGASASNIAVTIEPASPPDILPLLMAAHALTERESQIVQAMLRGESTHAIAQAMHLSPYTVQDHFKGVFEKLGVSSRREVAWKVFYGHYLDRYGEPVTTTGGPA